MFSMRLAFQNYKQMAFPLSNKPTMISCPLLCFTSPLWPCCAASLMGKNTVFYLNILFTSALCVIVFQTLHHIDE